MYLSKINSHDNSWISWFSWGCVLFIFLTVWSCKSPETNQNGKTEILSWKDGKKTAISLTWDDGSRNQFKIALPIMDDLGFPATFYVITGNISGSEYMPEYLGRPVAEILKESENVLTDSQNLFERASLIAYAPVDGFREYHTQAGEVFESGDVKQAYRIIDKALKELRSVHLENKNRQTTSGNQFLSWDYLDSIAGNGHEIGSHTITHPRLAILDERHLLYELEKSKEDILNHIGTDYTFSAECPYGTEDERVMEYAYKIYPALRNRMPETFLMELNRSSDLSPGNSEKEYVQWQRGPLTDTPMELMKSWVDTCLAHENIWLVLVFHGVEGIGWEPKTKEELVEYFNYLKEKEDDIWIGTFWDVTKYIRERMYSVLEINPGPEIIKINLSHSLSNFYDFPLTLLSMIPDTWKEVRITQQGSDIEFHMKKAESGSYVIYNAVPNKGPILISRK
jgi:peptidoglycan/xylan/chitin deacetylase (PgdA/CDA1 family)